MKNILRGIFTVIMLVILGSCQERTDVVDSGTYQGTIKEVEADKAEIYVDTDDGKTLELYFTTKTRLTMNGDSAQFSALEEGQRVQVEVERVGNRLDPISVEIVEGDE